jgi:hypothetical protein
MLDQIKQVEAAPPAGAAPAGGAAPVDGGGPPPGGAPAPLTAPAGPDPSAPAPAAATVALSSLVGDWNASPNPDTSIAFSIKDDSTFLWKVTMKGTPKILSGTFSLGNDVLTLVPSSGDPLVGRVALTSPTAMSFKAMGGPPSDPGLSFTR